MRSNEGTRQGNRAMSGQNITADITNEDIINAIGQADTNRFLYIVDEASQLQGERLENFIRDKVAADLQANLARLEYAPACPECGSHRIKKNGKRRNIQRYSCLDCGHRFSSFSNTLLEKTNYSWDVWVEVIASMLAGTSIEKTVQVIRDDHHCPIINKDTVHLMRLKVMAAASRIAPPALSGIVQIDDMFVRENQKASRRLENTLPSDIQPRREPRYGETPSILGVRSSEFASITCMIDGTGHCACGVLGMGAISPEVLYDFIADRTGDVSFFCSDADTTYAQVFADMRVPHYIRPSKYLDIIKKAGYEQPSKTDKDAHDEQVAENARILENLWEGQLIDHIENRSKMTYKQFAELKHDNGLNISRVNELHNELREAIERRTKGVSTKMLPFYVGWFQYLHNKRIDEGHALISRTDAEKILLDCVRAGYNLTTTEIEDIRRRPMDFPKPSGRYLHMLMRATDDVRAASDDGSFKFDDESPLPSFNKREVMMSMPIGQLRELARYVHLKSWRDKKRTALVNDLAEKTEIEEVLYLIAAGETDWQDRNDTAIAAHGGARAGDRIIGSYNDERTLSQQRYDAFGHRNASNRYIGGEAGLQPLTGDIAFVDVETTGTNPSTDEILSVAVVAGDGEVLVDSLVKPDVRKRWTASERIHHIKPDDVADAPSLSDIKDDIEAALNERVIVGWNVGFDLRMLYACGVDVVDDASRRVDLMRAYCEWRKARDRSYTKHKDKLENAVKHLGIGGHNAHNAMSDTVVLLDVWRAITGE